MKKRLVVTLLAAIGMLSVWLAMAVPTPPPSENAPQPKELNLESIKSPGAFNLDHFLTYYINPIPVDFEVRLRGQFDNQFLPVRLTLYERFLNPVDKNGEGIIDKFSHLNWYMIDAPDEPRRQVSLYNQFGLQTIVIDQPYALLAPAEKVEPGSQFPAQLDHYKVYVVIEGEHPQIPVTLKDQFGSQGNVAMSPAFFAVPVEKRHNGQHFPIQNPDDHILFYRLDPIDVAEYRPTVDQFGRWDMKTLFSELLGVPSHKLAWMAQ